MDVDAQDKFQELMNIPAGDEATVESGAGGELEICQEMLDQLRVNPEKRFDPRTRRDRVHLNNLAWNEQMESLVQAYLQWQSNSRDGVLDAMLFNGYLPLMHADMSTLSVDVTDDAEYPNVAIARRGYLGTAPRTPKTAIAFNVLEAYRQLHRVCPKLSIYAQVQALCHLHGVRIGAYTLDQFSATFDVYLEILHQVDSRVNTALRRDTPQWRLRNTCPPCMYVLTNEPDLGLSMLCSMDKNSSLKLVDSSVRCGDLRQDERTHRIHDLLLTPDMVDRFKDEVASSNSGKAPAVQHGNHDEHPGPSLLSSADCVEKWRAAAPEERKRAFALFHTTGVFASFCRHGHALVYCDMIRSGELYVSIPPSLSITAD
ncbi:hypothetical protein BC835DRAFT_1285766 [Cytidiella melzeri]|nr:hypothetical protein BC835DRAFT_1285766 [Cytidiella melzeri]